MNNLSYLSFCFLFIWVGWVDQRLVAYDQRYIYTCLFNRHALGLFAGTFLGTLNWLYVEHCKSTYVTHLNTHTIHPRKLPSSSTGELALFDPSVSIHVLTKAGAPLENKLVTSQSHIGFRNFELLAQVAFKVPRLFDRRNCTPHVVQRSNTHRQRTKLPLNIGGWRRLAKAIVSLFTLVF
jgi:hypothetical protein